MTDTIKLLRECNAGIKMGEDAIKQVLPHAHNEDLKHTLQVCKNTHATLGDETHKLLKQHGADTKDPHPVIKAMSNMKIYATMLTNDHTPRSQPCNAYCGRDGRCGSFDLCGRDNTVCSKLHQCHCKTWRNGENDYCGRSLRSYFDFGNGTCGQYMVQLPCVFCLLVRDGADGCVYKRDKARAARRSRG